jgi:hypothetical protein
MAGCDLYGIAAVKSRPEATGISFLIGAAIFPGIGLAKLKQLNHKDHEDRKEKSLRGLCCLRGSNSRSTALTCARSTNG